MSKGKRVATHHHLHVPPFHVFPPIHPYKKAGSMLIHSVRDLEVYKLAFAVAMEIFRLTKTFPVEERYSMSDQIRRASRSVCANLAEAWRKRRYQAVFINKLSDAMQEASETQTWLEFSLACGYIDQQVFSALDSKYEQILSMLNSMERKAESFCLPKS